MNELLRLIPQVSSILEDEWFQTNFSSFAPEITTQLIRESLEIIRKQIQEGIITSKEEVEKQIQANLEKRLSILVKRSLIKVINATGIPLHTNLGRAPMASNPYLNEILESYCNLEFELGTGKRGKRGVHARSVLQVLLGCEAAVVVNNNAAALLLFLKTHAEGKEVIVSRGELIELGGSFRLPEVMKASGCILKEVGTTNRTHLKDYADAITENTAMILKVHPSNYMIRGFTTAPESSELAMLAKERNIVYAYDIGSGLIRKVNHPSFRDEPDCTQALREGADAVLFSGDKILGGTQAGFIVGSERVAGACGKVPLMRSLRLSKGHMCMIEDTLRIWLYPNEEVIQKNPVMRMISMSLDELQQKADLISGQINGKANKQIVESVKVVGQMGGGSLPDVDFDSYAIKILGGETPQTTLAKLRNLKVPIIGRVDNDSVVLDVRTILPGEEQIVIESISNLYA